jgi:hypothetical protein
VSFRINDGKRRLSIETCRRPKELDEWFNRSLFILLRQNQCGHSGSMIEIVCGKLGISTSSPPRLCDVSLTASGDQSHTSTTVNQPVQQDGEKGERLLQEKDVASLPLVKRCDSIRGMQIR